MGKRWAGDAASIGADRAAESHESLTHDSESPRFDQRTGKMAAQELEDHLCAHLDSLISRGRFHSLGPCCVPGIFVTKHL